MPVELRVLGAPALLDVSGQPLQAVVVQPKRFGLLVFLVLARPSGFHRRDALLALFWPDQPEDRARNALNQALSFLRRSLGADVLPSRGTDDVGVNHSLLSCDALAFCQATDRGDHEVAVALYAGDLLPAFHLDDAPAFGDWLEQQRRLLRDRAAASAAALSKRADELGDTTRAIDWAARGTLLAPFDETLAQRLAVLHDRSGNPARAMQAYEDFAARIRAEFELEPSPAFGALLEGIRSRSKDVALTTSRVPNGARHVALSLPIRADFEPLPAPRPRSTAVRLPVAIASTLLAVVVSAMVWRSVAHPVSERFPLTLATGERVNNALGVGPSVLAIAPNGRLIAYSALNSDGRTHLFLRSLDSTRARVVDGSFRGETPFFSPDGKWLGFHASGHLWKVGVTGGTPIRIADVAEINGASWSTTDTIVLGAPNGRLAKVSASGGDLLPVTTPDQAARERHMWPLVLRDGETVLYTSCTCNAEERSNFLIAATNIGDGKQQLFSIPGASPIAVVERQLIYADSTGALMAIAFDPMSVTVSGAPVLVEDHVVLRMNGQARAALAASGTLLFQSDVQSDWRALLSDERHSATLFQHAGVISAPRYSPNGEFVAYSSTSPTGSDVWIYDVASRVRWQLTSGGGVNNRPEWTADSKRVVFISDRAGPFETWIQPIDRASPAVPLFALNDGATIEAVLTPDGNTLIYRSGRKLQQDVWYRGLRGDTVSKPIANTAATERNPRPSPDGNWIAYTSDESGVNEVYVSPLPGPGSHYRVSGNGGLTPVWSRDGRTLFFTHAQQLVAASLALAPEFQVVARRIAFGEDEAFSNAESGGGHANFDVAPDGKSIVLVKPIGPDRPVIVVTHWDQVLHARVAVAQRR